ncbi:hypothetical protein SAY87_021947 [Trapa incisa]|uniref:Phytocyanin domain-containing protein n=1 Tax=Trapa incisa TaxID=236973 RepID=A0AAN7JU37_9MYRT|nr:hypothetical protein SAY87_021947 [Trapa incisa]
MGCSWAGGSLLGGADHCDSVHSGGLLWLGHGDEPTPLGPPANTFLVGDSLTNYGRGAHAVDEVSSSDYSSCTPVSTTITNAASLRKAVPLIGSALTSLRVLIAHALLS